MMECLPGILDPWHLIKNRVMYTAAVSELRKEEQESKVTPAT